MQNLPDEVQQWVDDNPHFQKRWEKDATFRERVLNDPAAENLGVSEDRDPLPDYVIAYLEARIEARGGKQNILDDDGPAPA